MYDWRSAYYDASYDSYIAASKATTQKKTLPKKQQQNQQKLRAATVKLNDNFTNSNISDEYVYVYNIEENNENDFYHGNNFNSFIIL